MGKLEKEARSRRRWGQVQYALLAVVGISGLLLVTAAAPNALKLLKYLPKNKYRFGNQAKSGLSRLADKGYVKFVEAHGKKHAELTERGRRELLLLQQKFENSASKRRRWDKRWRIVSFDISEKVAGKRVSLRRTMQSFGFYRLQDSVWVYPYDCEDVIGLLKTNLGLGSAVLYMIVEKIENDRRLREHFEV
ncbi:MAG: hypothetical protein AAB790_03230 [Patescibacteria group bacterium]